MARMAFSIRSASIEISIEVEDDEPLDIEVEEDEEDLLELDEDDLDDEDDEITDGGEPIEADHPTEVNITINPPTPIDRGDGVLEYPPDPKYTPKHIPEQSIEPDVDDEGSA